MSDWGTNVSHRASKAVSNASGGTIHIKPSHKGLLHNKLGVPQGQPIPEAKLASKPTDSPALSKEKNFARNAKGWNHG